MGVERLLMFRKLFAYPHGWKGSDDLSFYVFNCSDQGARINLEVRVINHAHTDKTCVKSVRRFAIALLYICWISRLLPNRRRETEFGMGTSLASQ